MNEKLQQPTAANTKYLEWKVKFDGLFEQFTEFFTIRHQALLKISVFEGRLEFKEMKAELGLLVDQ